MQCAKNTTGAFHSKQLICFTLTMLFAYCLKRRKNPSILDMPALK